VTHAPHGDDAPIITQHILKEYQLHGIESASFAYGTNTITVIAKWNESISQIVEKIKRMPWVLDVSGRIGIRHSNKNNNIKSIIISYK